MSHRRICPSKPPVNIDIIKNTEHVTTAAHSLCTHTGWPLSRQCEIPPRFAALLRGTRHVNCYSYHARTSVTATKYLYGCKYAAISKQFYATFPWQDFFPDVSLTCSKIPDISLIAVKFDKFPDISRQVVTLSLYVAQHEPDSPKTITRCN